MNAISFSNIGEISKEDDNARYIAYKGLVLDTQTKVLNKNGIDIQLTNKEYQLMKVFMAKPDIPISKENMFFDVWDEDSVYDDKLLIIHIFRLRHKIGDNNEPSAYIRNIRGYGYIFGNK